MRPLGAKTATGSQVNDRINCGTFVQLLAVLMPLPVLE